MNSRQRPHGVTAQSKPLSSLQTATIVVIRYSPAVTMAAMALCSAQKPVPEPVSMQTPEKRWPVAVHEHRRHISEEAPIDLMREEHVLRRVDELLVRCAVHDLEATREAHATLHPQAPGRKPRQTTTHTEGGIRDGRS
jgi:hypothetical protein